MPKITFSIFFAIFIALNCFSQSKKPILSLVAKDSVSLAKYLNKISKELLTKEWLEKHKQQEQPLRTLTIVYREQIILTTAKND
jgi:hypothetical protein